MRSMTGFGLGEVPLATGRLGVEVRGVNHRFLDVRVRLPRELGDLSGFVEQIARDRLTRGRYEVAVRIEGIALGAPVLDRDRARAAYKALCDLRDELAPGADVPLSLLASIPELFVSSADRELDLVRTAARAAFEAAAASLDAMRVREGEALKGDLVRRLDRVRALARDIQRRSPEVLEAHRRRLRERAERLRIAAEVEADATRLEQEIAVFAERCDITEELTRLDSHCAQLAALVASDEAVGRRLDFLLQEMAREANTVGAKSPDAQIAHAVVEVKAEIERMREQVQNVE
ncbi:MAG TPA: YicC/YloC family endoribonuclease [Polyangiaceae bacterium]|nr:YicC/YloC family endoribonuclease [Polyangiaceae bacterium]